MEFNQIPLAWQMTSAYNLSYQSAFIKESVQVHGEKMAKKALNWRDIRRNRQSEQFVGRENHLALFRDNLTLSDEDPENRS